MSKIEVLYISDLRTEANHVDSGDHILTDAPKDNMGQGEAFSPTDLFATALGSCMLTIMGISANTQNINIDGSKVFINKLMGTGPRRIIAIDLVFDIKGKLTDKQKTILIKSAKHCPVSKSIHPDIKETIKFNFLGS